MRGADTNRPLFAASLITEAQPILTLLTTLKSTTYERVNRIVVLVLRQLKMQRRPIVDHVQQLAYFALQLPIRDHVRGKLKAASVIQLDGLFDVLDDVLVNRRLTAAQRDVLSIPLGHLQGLYVGRLIHLRALLAGCREAAVVASHVALVCQGNVDDILLKSSALTELYQPAFGKRCDRRTPHYDVIQQPDIDHLQGVLQNHRKGLIGTRGFGDT